MKILFLLPRFYSLIQTLSEGFEELGHEITIIDFPQFFSSWYNHLIVKTIGLPERITKYWSSSYFKKINSIYIKYVDQIKPDLILVYNDQYIFPETVAKIKNEYCPIFNYLGDNPFYVFNRPSNIASLMEMSYIFAPDSFWCSQLKLLGIENIEFLLFGYSKKLNYPVIPSFEEKKLFGNDLVMIGRTYRNNWGYKRAFFYNQFADLDLKIYGKGWNIWFDYFPKLKNRYIELHKPLSFKEVNLILNCSKIYAIDANPGLITGLHARIFDCIGSGILPLVEYRNDLEKVFKNLEIPTIKNYNEASEIANKYLQNDIKRIALINELRKFLDLNYTPQIAAKKIIKVFNAL